MILPLPAPCNGARTFQTTVTMYHQAVQPRMSGWMRKLGKRSQRTNFLPTTFLITYQRASSLQAKQVAVVVVAGAGVATSSID